VAAYSFSATKDQSEVLDYTFDWTEWLDDGDTIASCTVSQPTGLTVSAPTVASPLVTVRVSGGTTGEEYDLVWHATGSDGQQPERTLRLSIRDK
jgi:hypothetical protein